MLSSPGSVCFHLPKHSDQDTCNLAGERLGSLWGHTCSMYLTEAGAGDRVQSLWRISANLSPSPWSLGSALICPRSCCCWVCLPFPTLHLWPLKPPGFTEDPPRPTSNAIRQQDRLVPAGDGKCMFQLLEKHPEWLHLETLLALVSLGHLPGPVSLVTTVHGQGPPSPRPPERCPQPCRAHWKLPDCSPCVSSTTHVPSLPPAAPSRCGRTVTLFPESRYSQIPGGWS